MISECYPEISTGRLQVMDSAEADEYRTSNYRSQLNPIACSRGIANLKGSAKDLLYQVHVCVKSNAVGNSEQLTRRRQVLLTVVLD